MAKATIAFISIFMFAMTSLYLLMEPLSGADLLAGGAILSTCTLGLWTAFGTPVRSEVRRANRPRWSV